MEILGDNQQGGFDFHTNSESAVAIVSNELTWSKSDFMITHIVDMTRRQLSLQWRRMYLSVKCMFFYRCMMVWIFIIYLSGK